MTQSKDISPLAWGLLALLGLIWGGSFLSIRIALNEVGFLTSVAHRTGWAMVILWSYVLIRRLPVPTDRRIWIGFLGMGLLNNAIPFSLMAWGQLYIESGLTSILNAATAIFGVVLAALFFADERLSARKVIGVTVGFFGVATAIGLEHLLAFDPRSLAQLAVIGGTISYAFAGIWARKRLSGLKPEVAATGMLTGSTFIMLPAAWLIEGPITLNLQPITWLAIGYYTVIATALAYLLYYRILALAGSGTLMLVTLLVPPIAILLGTLFLGETLHPRAYLGFALLALGLIILDGRALRAVDAKWQGK
ncbi:DMT family transporter [Planktotalea arctica]|uniref:DMT family transporter n=1 Tax=Planktotalea arctica TaxID=1481893 RepID=UPI000A16F09D|nr:DMT family transporter [Planktotalea arctica]